MTNLRADHIQKNSKMKIIVRLLKREAIKDIFSIVILTLTFSIVYTLIVYGDFNFIEKAKNRETSSFNSEFREITIEEAQKYFNNALIIDARAEQDYASGHIPNSINISSKILIVTLIRFLKFHKIL